MTPFHAFVGPNDSGKSTLLRAAEAAAIGAGIAGRHPRPIKELTSRILPASTTMRITARVPGPVDYILIEAQGDAGRVASSDPQSEWRFSGGGAGSGAVPSQVHAAALAALGRVSFVRLSQASLIEPSLVITEAEALDFPNNPEVSLAGVLEVIQARADGSIEKLSQELADLFPTVQRLLVPTTRLDDGRNGKTVRVVLKSGEVIDAHALSEGLLYYLAFAALAQLGLPTLLLVEEPENGLHPSRIAEVMRVLRVAAAGKTQVVFATHSPLVINEMAPEEVTLVTRTLERGTICTPMKNTRAFAERPSVYSLGELWSSYANGIDEKDLVEGGA